MEKNETRQERLEALARRLTELSEEELGQVDHLLDSLAKSKRLGRHLVGHFLGIDIQDGTHTDPEVTATMLVGPHNINSYGVAHGGALYSFADVAIGYSVIKDLKPHEKTVTLEMKMNYVKPGRPGRLIAKAKLLHWGRQTVVGQCTIEGEDGELVAHALGTFFIVRGEI